jgi:methylated-DNA-protein-cysteine methyltransferase-like protein
MPAAGRDSNLTRQRILAVVDSIPAGCVASYGQVAQAAGLPRRARLVGRVLAELPAGTGIPWHRVLGAGGRISRDSSAAARQARRLRAEGVGVSPSGRVDWERCRWRAEP